MEKVVWKGTFAAAEIRENAYWAAQSEEERLAAMLRMRAVFFDTSDEPMVKVAIKRKIGDEKE